MKKKKKKIWPIIIAVIVVLMLLPSGNKSTSTATAPERTVSETPDTEATEAEAPVDEAAADESTDEAVADPDKAALQNELASKYHMSVDKTVPEDRTGKWRLGKYLSDTPIQEIALDYYKAFFESDDEIHIVVNYNLDTTSRVALMTSQTIVVTVKEHIENEELSAKTLGGGAVLAEYWVNTETGEIEQLDLTDDELTDEQRAFIEEADAKVESN